MSISYLIYQAGGGVMIFAYFRSLWYWYQAGDLILTFPLGHSYLNEIPMSEFLDTYTKGDDPAIVSYHFTAKDMGRVMGDTANFV